ncbi:anti-sigma factor domain-containing protein [Agromyces sp. GXS1127]|uniref:anti-sigma factor n=1 Tax=Agromyces sp. GXS1127 TaxID=3424181 RepID=UPI003D31C6BF
MTDPEFRERREREDLDGLLDAYALDAVSDEERAIVEARLAESPELRAEVAARLEAAAALAEAVEPVSPPPTMKDSILDRLDEVAQVPVTGVEAAERAAVAAAGAGANAARDPQPAASVAGPVEREARRRWFQRPAAIVAAVAAAVLLVAGAIVGVNWPGPAGWGAQREVQAIASAPDARSATVAAADGGEVTVVWSEQLGESAVRASGLPEVGADSTYELWYIDASGATPAGTFDPDDGAAYVVLDGQFRPGVIVGMTVEPAGGSEAPTTEPVVVVET